MSLDTSKCSSGGGGAGGLEEDVEGEDKQAGELFLCITYQIKAGFFCSLWKKLSVEKTPITLLSILPSKLKVPQAFPCY